MIKKLLIAISTVLIIALALLAVALIKNTSSDDQSGHQDSGSPSTKSPGDSSPTDLESANGSNGREEIIYLYTTRDMKAPIELATAAYYREYKGDDRVHVRIISDDIPALMGRISQGEEWDLIVLYSDEDMEQFSRSGFIQKKDVRRLAPETIALVAPYGEGSPSVDPAASLVSGVSRTSRPASTFDDVAGVIGSGTDIAAVLSWDQADINAADAFFKVYGLDEELCGRRGALTYGRSSRDLEGWLQYGNISAAIMSHKNALAGGYAITDIMAAGPNTICPAAIAPDSPAAAGAGGYLDFMASEAGLAAVYDADSKSTRIAAPGPLALSGSGSPKNEEDSLVTQPEGQSFDDPADMPSGAGIPPDEFIPIPPGTYTADDTEEQYHHNTYYTREGYMFVGDDATERALSICISTLDYRGVPDEAYQSVINRVYEESPYSWTCGFDKHAHGRALVISGYEQTDVAEANAEVLQAAKRIVTDFIRDDMTETEKVRAIYTWFHNNVTYDHELKEVGFHAYGALIRRHACCQGYAKAIQIVADLAGLKTCLVGGSNHAFAAVRADGEWYYTDPTKSIPLATPREYVTAKRFISDSYWLRKGKDFIYE